MRNKKGPMLDGPKVGCWVLLLSPLLDSLLRALLKSVYHKCHSGEWLLQQRQLAEMTWFKSKCLCFSVNSSIKRLLAMTRTLPEFNHIIVEVVEEFLSSWKIDTI